LLRALKEPSILNPKSTSTEGGKKPWGQNGPFFLRFAPTARDRRRSPRATVFETPAFSIFPPCSGKWRNLNIPLFKTRNPRQPKPMAKQISSRITTRAEEDDPEKPLRPSRGRSLRPNHRDQEKSPEWKESAFAPSLKLCRIAPANRSGDPEFAPLSKINRRPAARFLKIARNR